MVKKLPAMQETWVGIPRSGRSPGEGNGYPLQCSCLENSMNRGAWWATAHWVAESDTTKWLTLSLSVLLLRKNFAVRSGLSLKRIHSGLFFFLFIYLLLVVLGLRCCVLAFSSCGKPGLFFCAVGRLLIVVVSLAAKL